VATDAADVVSISGTVSDGKYTTLQDYQGHGYEVPAGKTLVITGGLVQMGAGGAAFHLGYGDVAAYDQASITGSVLVAFSVRPPADGYNQPWKMLVKVAAGKFPLIAASGGGAVVHLSGVLM
jgi:hypothetical protein